jgi:hypothetical protein
MSGQNIDPNDFLQNIFFKSTGANGGNTAAQDLMAGNIGAGSTPESAEFLHAMAPRYIKSPPPPNVINKAPHIDSPMVDGWINDYRERDLLRGPQLPGFL